MKRWGLSSVLRRLSGQCASVVCFDMCYYLSCLLLVITQHALGHYSMARCFKYVDFMLMFYLFLLVFNDHRDKNQKLFVITHTSMFVYACNCPSTCICLYACLWLCFYMHFYVRVCLHARTCVILCVCMHAVVSVCIIHCKCNFYVMAFSKYIVLSPNLMMSRLMTCVCFYIRLYSEVPSVCVSNRLFCL